MKEGADANKVSLYRRKGNFLYGRLGSKGGGKEKRYFDFSVGFSGESFGYGDKFMASQAKRHLSKRNRIASGKPEDNFLRGALQGLYDHSKASAGYVPYFISSLDWFQFCLKFSKRLIFRSELVHYLEAAGRAPEVGRDQLAVLMLANTFPLFEVNEAPLIDKGVGFSMVIVGGNHPFGYGMNHFKEEAVCSASELGSRKAGGSWNGLGKALLVFIKKQKKLIEFVVQHCPPLKPCAWNVSLYQAGIKHYYQFFKDKRKQKVEELNRWLAHELNTMSKPAGAILAVERAYAARLILYRLRVKAVKKEKLSELAKRGELGLSKMEAGWRRLFLRGSSIVMHNVSGSEEEEWQLYLFLSVNTEMRHLRKRLREFEIFKEAGAP